MPPATRVKDDKEQPNTVIPPVYDMDEDITDMPDPKKSLRVTHIIDFECPATAAYVEKVLPHSFNICAAALVAPKTLSHQDKVKRACVLAETGNISLYVCPFEYNIFTKSTAKRRLTTLLAQTTPQVIHAHGPRAAHILHMLKSATPYKFYPLVHSFYSDTPETPKRADVKRIKSTRTDADIVLHSDPAYKEELLYHGAAGEDDPVLPSANESPQKTAEKLCAAYRSVAFMHKRLSLYAADRLTGS